MTTILFHSKNFTLGCLIALLFLVCAFEGDTPCDAKVLKEKAKKQLEPYTYDMSKLTHIAYRSKPWTKEIEVPLFIGEKYRMVFNTEALPKQVIINVYNRDKESKKRKLLFSSKDQTDKKSFFFDIALARKAFIDYEIPAGDSTSTGGCLVFMVGYK